MFSLIFEIIGGFLLAILREIPGAFLDGIFYGLFYDSPSKTSGENEKQSPFWLKILYALGLIIVVLYFGALIFRYFNG
jgi:hypothetical protein